MNRLVACRVCLAYDTRLCSILDCQFRDIYEKLVEAPLVLEDMLPTSVCYICFSLMKKMLQFRNRSWKSNQILQQIIDIKEEPSVSSLDILVKARTGISWPLGMSVIETTNTTSGEVDLAEARVKIESVKSEIDIDETSEWEEDYSGSMPVCRDSTSESEDDLPVQNLSEQCKPDQIKIVKTLKVMLTRISDGHAGAAPHEKRKIHENVAENEVVNIQAPLRETEKNEETREMIGDEKEIPNLRKEGNKFKTILKEAKTTSSNTISGDQNDGEFNNIDAVTPPEDIFTCGLRKNVYHCKNSLESHMKKSHVIELNRKSSISLDLNVTNEFKSVNLLKLQEIQNNDKRKENNRRENKLRDNTTRNECQYCMKRFIFYSELIGHLRIHSKEKPFKCDICDKGFSQKPNFIRHLRVHSGEKPFKCDVCKKGFSQRYHLISHLRVHSKEKPFKCDICEKDFSQRHHLISHLRVHSREKPFKCDICEKGFSGRGDLIKHLRVHSGEKPFKCGICEKSFSRNDNLTLHLRVHSKEKPFKM